jgi:hypothetical protein
MKQPEVVAWLIAGGRIFKDAVRLYKAGALQASEERKDGSTVEPLIRLSDYTSLQERVKALEADARRYQHVIDRLGVWHLIAMCTDWFVGHRRFDTPETKESLDKAIDSAGKEGASNG